VAQLIVVEGPNRGKTYDLEERTVVGSGTAVRKGEGDRFEILNLQPRQNLLVNGEVAKRRWLSHGDWISCADTTFVFSDELPRERHSLEISFHAEEVGASRITARRPSFGSAEDVIDSFDDEEFPGRPPVALPGQRERLGTKDRLATLYRVSTAISKQLHLPKLLDAIMELCFEVFPAERGFVLLLDEVKKKLRCVASRRRDSSEPLAAPDISRTIVREVFQKRESIASVDAANDERFLAGQSIAGGLIKSVMCAPLITEGRIIGVVQLDTTSTLHDFNDDDLDLLSAIAMQCAVAIENARAYKKRQEYSRSLIYLARALHTLSGFLNRDQIVREAVKAACSLLGCTKGSLLLRREGGRRLQLVYAVGMGKELAQDVAQTPDLGRRYVRRVVESGQPLLVPNVRRLSGKDHRGTKSRYASDSFLIVPVFYAGEAVESRGKPIGALCLTDKLSEGQFSGNDQEVLQILAAQTGTALANAELYEKATIDTLTRVHVRRYLFQTLEVQVRNAHFMRKALSVLMIDVDHFKRVNDDHGHAAGDAVLRQLGSLLKRTVRQGMTCARYGGEEFTVVCPGMDAKNARRVAERIRKSVETFAFQLPGGATLPCTASLGVATLQGTEDHEQLLQRADQALYAAKDGGRNQVVSAAGPPRDSGKTRAPAPEGQPATGDGDATIEFEESGPIEPPKP
jgi:diguanylate cyclase (GGDEF)-like protein